MKKIVVTTAKAARGVTAEADRWVVTDGGDDAIGMRSWTSTGG
ncbi:hypothetical protein OVA13_11210 [Pseudoxanthomonas sp. SL93]|jgi:hypothetical protein|nr:hypothetical protein [Pseudoxanthomonas sp. SL93]WAC61971.1 hypothetical protein OVA13_11210 [Pseudoxanthomonas sp. SL93]